MMLARAENEFGWHAPPPGAEPPRDYAPEERSYVGPHPIKRGLAAVLGVVGFIAVLPFIVIALLIWLWLVAMAWCTGEDFNDYD